MKGGTRSKHLIAVFADAWHNMYINTILEHWEDDSF